MPIPFVDLQAQYKTLKSDIDAAIAEVLQSSVYVLGPVVEEFEHAFAGYCGVKHCIGVGSGTAALSLLLQAHGVRPGDEVITVANSFFASAEAISVIGAVPVLVDCEPQSALIDVSRIEAAITPKTRAIMPVHLYGQTADMTAIVEIARAKNLLVIEDACQAHGALYGNKRAGGLADGAAFSFYPGKNLGAYGDAGAITTNDDAIAMKLRALREHGMTKKYVHRLVGWNERLDALQAAVLNVKLKHLDAWNAARRTHAARYRARLEGIGDIRFFTELPQREHNYHLCVLHTTQRDALQKHLEKNGITTLIHYPIPIHLQAAYGDHWKPGAFPVAEQLSQHILSLPMYAELTDTEIDTVCDAVVAFFKG